MLVFSHTKTRGSRENSKLSKNTIIFILFSFAIFCGRHIVTAYANHCRLGISTVLTFPVGGNRSARRKPTTFGRKLLYFSYQWSPSLYVAGQLVLGSKVIETRLPAGDSNQVVKPLLHQNPNITLWWLLSNGGSMTKFKKEVMNTIDTWPYLWPPSWNFTYNYTL